MNGQTFSQNVRKRGKPHHHSLIMSLSYNLPDLFEYYDCGFVYRVCKVYINSSPSTHLATIFCESFLSGHTLKLLSPDVIFCGWLGSKHHPTYSSTALFVFWCGCVSQCTCVSALLSVQILHMMPWLDCVCLIVPLLKLHIIYYRSWRHCYLLSLMLCLGFFNF